MFPSLCFLSLQSGVDSRSPFLVSSSYILVMVSVLLPVFVFLQSRPAFNVFSFASPVSSCLIHSCCVPNMFPLTVSFLMCIYCVSFPFSLVYMSPCLKCLGISRCSKFNEFTFPSLGFCDYFCLVGFLVCLIFFKNLVLPLLICILDPLTLQIVTCPCFGLHLRATSTST